MSSDVERSIVYDRPGRFAGWPANYGLWAWGNEIVTIFVSGWTGPLIGTHARDKSRPFRPVQMRSLDYGRTWRQEKWTGFIPGGRGTLSGDEHVDVNLQVAPTLSSDCFTALVEPINFQDPETIVMCARSGLSSGSTSWFYVSRDRGARWNGPFAIPDPGTDGIAARTDIISLDRDNALFMLTCPREDGEEGRILSVVVGNGGRDFEFRGWIDEHPSGWNIMPSSVRLGDEIITAVRAAGPKTEGQRRHWIDVHRTTDEGATWEKLSTPVADTGTGGNPPALVESDGQLVLVYGVRSSPFGLRSVISRDKGRSWTAPKVLTDDAAMRDMGYPRAVALDDGTVLALWYTNHGAQSRRSIEAARWRP